MRQGKPTFGHKIAHEAQMAEMGPGPIVFAQIDPEEPPDNGVPAKPDEAILFYNGHAIKANRTYL